MSALQIPDMAVDLECVHPDDSALCPFGSLAPELYQGNAQCRPANIKGEIQAGLVPGGQL